MIKTVRQHKTQFAFFTCLKSKLQAKKLVEKIPSEQFSALSSFVQESYGQMKSSSHMFEEDEAGSI
jgi:hypothetical protein